MRQRKVDGDLTAMGASNQRGALDAGAAQDRRQVIAFPVSGRRNRRPAIAAAIVADRVEARAECWPDIISDSGVHNAIVD